MGFVLYLYQCPAETQASEIKSDQAFTFHVSSLRATATLVYRFYSFTHAGALVSTLTFLAVEARVSCRANALALHAAPSVVALEAVLAHLLHHLTVLSCRGRRTSSGGKPWDTAYGMAWTKGLIDVFCPLKKIGFYCLFGRKDVKAILIELKC